jgi:hypothetical protein
VHIARLNSFFLAYHFYEHHASIPEVEPIPDFIVLKKGINHGRQGLLWQRITHDFGLRKPGGEFGKRFREDFP